MSKHQPSALVHFECKNYSSDIANPELDQISSRFSPNRGKFGIICFREFKDRRLFAKRCHDTASDGRGFVVSFDDGDFKELVESRKKSADFFALPVLKRQFDRLLS